MAVRSLNFFEQHAGKLFLAAVALGALALIYSYVIRRPVEYAGKQNELAAKTKELGARIGPNSKPVSPLPESPDISKFKPAEAPALTRDRLTSFIGRRPSEERPFTELKEIELAKYTAHLRAPGMPELQVGRGVVQAPALDAAGQPIKDKSGKAQIKDQEARWVVVSVPVPFESIRKFFETLVGDLPPDTVPNEIPPILDVRLVRQEADASGQPLAGRPPVEVPRCRGSWDNSWPAFPVGGAERVVAAWRDKMGVFKEGLRKNQAALVWPDFYQYNNQPVVVHDTILAVQRQREEREKKQPPAGETDPDAAAGAANVPPADAPPDPARDDAGWVYAFDETAGESVRYVYKVRVGLLNPLLDRGLLKGEQNRQIAIDLPDSPWSAPVQLEPSLYVFLTSAGANTPITANVFRFARGRMRVKNFPVAIGLPLGGTVATDQGEVDFSTGLVPIDIRKEEVFPRRPDASQFGARPLDVVIFAQAPGRLFTRCLEADQNDPEHAKLRRMVE